jgi:hypothetical protein
MCDITNTSHRGRSTGTGIMIRTTAVFGFLGPCNLAISQNRTYSVLRPRLHVCRYSPGQVPASLSTDAILQSCNLRGTVPASFYGPDSFGNRPTKIWYRTGTQAPGYIGQLTAWQIPGNWPKTRSKSSQGSKS